jgi:hypothetical protein
MMMFWVLAPCRLSSALKMEAVCFFETLASTYESTRCQSPDHHHPPHRRENLKSPIDIRSVLSEIKLADEQACTTSQVCVHFMVFVQRARKKKTKLNVKSVTVLFSFIPFLPH